VTVSVTWYCLAGFGSSTPGFVSSVSDHKYLQFAGLQWRMVKDKWLDLCAPMAGVLFAWIGAGLLLPDWWAAIVDEGALDILEFYALTTPG
jgi:hypothetical protein